MSNLTSTVINAKSRLSLGPSLRYKAYYEDDTVGLLVSNKLASNILLPACTTEGFKFIASSIQEFQSKHRSGVSSYSAYLFFLIQYILPVCQRGSISFRNLDRAFHLFEYLFKSFTDALCVTAFGNIVKDVENATSNLLISTNDIDDDISWFFDTKEIAISVESTNTMPTEQTNSGGNCSPPLLYIIAKGLQHCFFDDFEMHHCFDNNGKNNNNNNNFVIDRFMTDMKSFGIALPMRLAVATQACLMTSTTTAATGVFNSSHASSRKQAENLMVYRVWGTTRTFSGTVLPASIIFQLPSHEYRRIEHLLFPRKDEISCSITPSSSSTSTVPIAETRIISGAVIGAVEYPNEDPDPGDWNAGSGESTQAASISRKWVLSLTEHSAVADELSSWDTSSDSYFSSCVDHLTRLGVNILILIRQTSSSSHSYQRLLDACVGAGIILLSISRRFKRSISRLFDVTVVNDILDVTSLHISRKKDIELRAIFDRTIHSTNCHISRGLDFNMHNEASQSRSNGSEYVDFSSGYCGEVFLLGVALVSSHPMVSVGDVRVDLPSYLDSLRCSCSSGAMSHGDIVVSVVVSAAIAAQATVLSDRFQRCISRLQAVIAADYTATPAASAAAVFRALLSAASHSDRNNHEEASGWSVGRIRGRKRSGKECAREDGSEIRSGGLVIGAGLVEILIAMELKTVIRSLREGSFDGYRRRYYVDFQIDDVYVDQHVADAARIAARLFRTYDSGTDEHSDSSSDSDSDDRGNDVRCNMVPSIQLHFGCREKNGQERALPFSSEDDVELLDALQAMQMGCEMLVASLAGESDSHDGDALAVIDQAAATLTSYINAFSSPVSLRNSTANSGEAVGDNKISLLLLLQSLSSNQILKMPSPAAASYSNFSASSYYSQRNSLSDVTPIRDEVDFSALSVLDSFDIKREAFLFALANAKTFLQFFQN